MNALGAVCSRARTAVTGSRGEEMTRRKQPAVGIAVSDASREREVQREIENFMRALTSYPDRFARNPYLSFEQHLFRIAAAGQPPRGESRDRG